MIANCKSYDRRLLTQTRYCYRYASHQPLPYPNKAEQSPDALIPQESSKRVLAPGSVPMGSSCSSSRSEGDGGVPLVNSSQGDGVVPRVISSQFISGGLARSVITRISPTLLKPSVSRCPVSVQASAPAMTCVVKGDPVAKKLLDCPFCQRALLTMAQVWWSAPRGYNDVEFIDFTDKPQWLLDVSGGKVPVLKVPSENLVMPDSDAICSYLEDKFPEPSMKSDVPADITAKIWSAGLAMLKEPDAEVAIELQAAFEAELEKSNAYLAEQVGTIQAFIDGAKTPSIKNNM
eukprot:gene1970-33384_t